MSDWLSKISIVTPLNKPLENGAEYYFKADLPDGTVSLWSKNKVLLGELKDGKIPFTAGAADDEVIVSSNVAADQMDLLLCLQRGDFRCVPAPEDLIHAKEYELSVPLIEDQEYTVKVTGDLGDWTGLWLGDDYFAGYFEDDEIIITAPAAGIDTIILKSLSGTASIERITLNDGRLGQSWTPAPEDVQAQLALKADTSSLGNLAFDDLVELAKLGSTIISGGYLKTSLVKIDGSSAFAAGYDPSDKRRTFTATPVPPYDVGDLWVGGSTGDIKRCKTAKGEDGSYAAGDWELASKYTDDSAYASLGSWVKEDTLLDALAEETIIIGGLIDTKYINIDSHSTFGTGYDPTGKVALNTEYKGVKINAADGFVSTATIGGKTATVKVNSVAGLAYYDGDTFRGGLAVVDNALTLELDILKAIGTQSSFVRVKQTSDAGRTYTNLDFYAADSNNSPILVTQFETSKSPYDDIFYADWISQAYGAGEGSIMSIKSTQNNAAGDSRLAFASVDAVAYAGDASVNLKAKNNVPGKMGGSVLTVNYDKLTYNTDAYSESFLPGYVFEVDEDDIKHMGDSIWRGGSSGSGANGSWTKFPDGTMICWGEVSLGSRTAYGSGTYADPYRTNTYNITLPQAFKSGSKPIAVLSSVRNAGTYASAARGNIISYRYCTTTQIYEVQGIATSSHSADAPDIECAFVVYGVWK